MRDALKRARSRSDGERSSRALQERRTTQDRELTDSERVDMLRRSMFQTHLPDLPKIPGYHPFWASTQNQRDPVHGRLRLGYEFIKPEEVPEFQSLSMKTGEYQGCIMVNEMIAMKLPLHLYEAYMREVHHDAPAREEEAIFNSAMQTSEQAAQSARRGGRMKGPVIESGTAELGQARDAPNFSAADEAEG